MIYHEDMTSKYGFSDGESVPPFVEKYRTVYVLTINKLAEHHGSNVRVIAYDRPGCHNWCLIIGVPKATYEAIKKDGEHYIVDGSVQLSDYGEWADPPRDDGYNTALEEAEEMGLDNFLDVRVDIDMEGLGECLEQFYPAVSMDEFERAL